MLVLLIPGVGMGGGEGVPEPPFTGVRIVVVRPGRRLGSVSDVIDRGRDQR